MTRDEPDDDMFMQLPAALLPSSSGGDELVEEPVLTGDIDRVPVAGSSDNSNLNSLSVNNIYLYLSHGLKIKMQGKIHKRVLPVR